MTRIPLSVLDLIHVPEGGTVAGAIEASMDLATALDRLGYRRLWYAEHHNMVAVASAATSVLVGRAAALTSRIRVGSGGVMLPNHAPLVVAEQYGTLAQMFPGRIDLGLGRAPGTDPLTARALHRTAADPQTFATAIWDMTGWFDDGDGRSTQVAAPVAAGTRVPIWVLGSTTSGASIAGQLGLPFAIASHFAPDQLHQALAVYRDSFNPGAPMAAMAEPYAMVGVNVLVADDDATAEYLFGSTLEKFASLRRGESTRLLPPGDVRGDTSIAERMVAVRAVGAPGAVVETLDALVAETGADELILATATHDPAARIRSFELLAGDWGLS